MTPPRAERGYFKRVWTPQMDRVLIRAVRLRRELTNKRLAVRLNVTTAGVEDRLHRLRRRMA